MSGDLVCHQFQKNLTALATAHTFLTSLPEFAGTDELMASIAGQIERKHYVFASLDGAVVGYAGWALCSPEVAEAYVAGTQTPDHEACRDGDVVLVMILGAHSAKATLELTNEIRRRYKGRRYVARRIRGFGLQRRQGRL